jgi:hypothetical protein
MPFYWNYDECVWNMNYNRGKINTRLKAMFLTQAHNEINYNIF